MARFPTSTWLHHRKFYNGIAINDSDISNVNATNDFAREHLPGFFNLNAFRTFGRHLGSPNRNIQSCTYTQVGSKAPLFQGHVRNILLFSPPLAVDANTHWFRYIIGKDLSFVHTFLLGPFLYLLVSIRPIAILISFTTFG